MLPHGSHHKNEGTPTTSAVHAFGNEHSGASLNAKTHSRAMRQRAEAGQGAAPGRVYIEMKRIKAKPTIIEMKIYLFD